MTALAVVDHLVYATADLPGAVAAVTARLGVAPVPGGRHVGRGTRNELLGLGGGSYLELIGPDADQPAPHETRPFGVDDLAGPRLVTWAARTIDLPGAQAAARAAGHDPGPARPMQRARPDGVVLAWTLTGPSPDGVLPFLIDWGTTPHPAATAPAGVTLVSLRLVHPAPDRVRAVLDAWGLGDVTVEAGETAAVSAELRGPGGTIVLT